MRTLFEMGFRNDFGIVLGQGEEQEWQSLQQSGGTIPSTTTTPTTTKPGEGGSDWAKLIAQGFKSASDIYGSLTKEQIAKMSKETENLRRQQQAMRPGMPPPAPSGGGISPNTLFIAGAVGVVGIILALTLR